MNFNLKNHHSYFAFSFVTILDHVYCLFLEFQTLRTYTVRGFFLDRDQKRYCYLSVSPLISKNVNGTIVCSLVFSKYVLSTILWHFNLKIHPPYLSCCSLHCKYTKHTLFLCLWQPKTLHLLFMMSFRVQKINRTLFLSSKFNILTGFQVTKKVPLMLLRPKHSIKGKCYVLKAYN